VVASLDAYGTCPPPLCHTRHVTKRILPISAVAAAAALAASATAQTPKPGAGAIQVANGKADAFTWGMYAEHVKGDKPKMCVLWDWAVPTDGESPSPKDAVRQGNRTCSTRSDGRYKHRFIVASVGAADVTGAERTAGGYYGFVPGATRTVRVVYTTKATKTKKARTASVSLRVVNAPRGFPAVKLFHGIAAPELHPQSLTKLRIEARRADGSIVVRKVFL
jgi:hypothetical protein